MAAFLFKPGLGSRLVAVGSTMFARSSLESGVMVGMVSSPLGFGSRNGIFSWNAIDGKHTLGVFCWIQLHYISIWVAENESFSHGAKKMVPVSIKWPWLGAQLKFSFHKEAIATKQHNH